MGHDKQNLVVAAAVPVVASAVSGNLGSQQAAQGGATSPAFGLSLTDAQFERLERALLTAAVVSGIVFSQPGFTLDANRLKRIREMRDAAVELL